MTRFTLDLDYDVLCADDFDYVANILLNQTQIQIADVCYRFVEIEFYLNNILHPDSYVHSNPDQLMQNKFYFHKFKNGTYKSGTYKGMDLTFGNEEYCAYFGILIRAILNTESNDIIEGPCNVVNHILKCYGVDNVGDLTHGKVLSINRNSSNLILNRTDVFDQEQMFIGPRIGLSAKYPPYQNKLYRYVIFKDRIKKQKTKLIKLV